MPPTRKRSRQQRVSRHWYLAKDGDPSALQLYERHYSCRAYKDGRVRRLFCGPGAKIVLITRNADALFVWRKQKYALDWQNGVCCAVFRNEGPVKSSRLIREAMQIAWKRWPGDRLYTYVNPTRIKGNNPGYCFKRAGWRSCGTSKGRRLVLLEASE